MIHPYLSEDARGRLDELRRSKLIEAEARYADLSHQPAPADLRSRQRHQSRLTHFGKQIETLRRQLTGDLP